MSSLSKEKYYAAIEKFVNKDPREWQKFRFCIYDVKGKGKITEKELFKFLQHTSIRPWFIDERPTKHLALNEF